MECYLDNSATTRCLDSAAALMAGILCTDYGNPSSLHHKGVQAEEYVRHAREVIAKTIIWHCAVQRMQMHGRASI